MKIQYSLLLFAIGITLLISGCNNTTRNSNQEVSITGGKQLSNNKNVYSSSTLSDGTILFGGENGLSLSSISNNRDKTSSFNMPIFTIENDTNSTNRSNDNNKTKQVKIYSIVNTDNNIFIGGSFSEVNGLKRNNLVKLNLQGTIDNDFNNTVNGTVFKILPLKNNTLLIGGTFGGYDSNIVHSIAKIDTNGKVDDTFIPFNDYLFVKINDIAKLQNDKIILAGTFVKEATSDDENRTRAEMIQMTQSIIVLNLDGTIDNKLSEKFIDIKNEAFVVEVSNGKVYIGGDFEFTKNSTIYNNLVAYTVDGDFVNDFIIDKLNGMIFDTKIISDKIIFVGDFILDNKSQTRSFYIVDEYGRTIKIDNFSTDADIYSIDIYQGNLILSGNGNFELNNKSYSNNIAIKLQ